MTKYNVKGFKSSGLCCGIKKDGKKDLGLIFSEKEANFSALFTKNKIKAAPLIVGQKILKKGKAQAFIVNSGNANCSTGKQGLIDAEETSKTIANALSIDSELVVPSSTGVIGEKLPIEKIKKASKNLVDSLDTSFENFAEAILTTDKKIKIVEKTRVVDNKEFSILGIVKGSGMIKPNMATLLCFILTDAKITSTLLKKALKKSCDASLNRITIDGDTSTNDSAFIVANGMSGAKINKNNFDLFQTILNEVLLSLSKKVVQDGEGVRKLVSVNVKNAYTKKDAYKIAESIAESSLVKTAIFGEDANWGRIMMAIGKTNAKINPDTIDIYFDNVKITQDSVYTGKDAENMVDEILKKETYSIVVDIKMGKEEETILTCDLSYNYIKINAGYRS